VRDVDDIADKVSAWMGESLGWDSRACRQEMDRYRAIKD
jgi:hypothetical protein